MKGRHTDQSKTRQQLLDAAAEVFAQRGFEVATVREICEKAHANIASINYHFRDKETLYTEVLKYALHRAHVKFPSALGLKPNATVEDRLRAFIQSFLLRIFEEGPQAWHGKLMLREMIKPTAALDALVDAEIRPMAGRLQAIVRDLLGKKAKPAEVRLSAMSIVSQILFYHHCRPVIIRMFPDLKFGPREIERLAEHITEFSLAALTRRKKG
jgi:TetR/AcrR family transcriptional regulator, regulator of cefoperazone and chloramphenicol sensitivity